MRFLGARRLWERYRRPIHLALSVIGAAALAFILLHPDGRGTDGFSYWSFDPAAPYAAAMGNVSAPVAFRYAPPIALALVPLQALSWPTFLWLLTGIILLALAWLCRSWVFAALAIYPILLDVSVANIHILMAAALVSGLRRPAAWSFLILTKVTPGIALIWFLARREWRPLAELAIATVTISILSWLIAPDLWPQWFAMLASDVGQQGDRSLPIPLIVRLPAAAALILWGAWTDRTWTLAPALLLAIPTIWPQSFAVLAAWPALQRISRRVQPLATSSLARSATTAAPSS